MQLRVILASGEILGEVDEKGEVYKLSGISRKKLGRVDCDTGEVYATELPRMRMAGGVAGSPPSSSLVGFARPESRKVCSVCIEPKRVRSSYKISRKGRVSRAVGKLGWFFADRGMRLAWTSAPASGLGPIGRGTPCMKTHDSIHSAERGTKIPREALLLASALLLLDVEGRA